MLPKNGVAGEAEKGGFRDGNSTAFNSASGNFNKRAALWNQTYTAGNAHPKGNKGSQFKSKKAGAQRKSTPNNNQAQKPPEYQFPARIYQDHSNFYQAHFAQNSYTQNYWINYFQNPDNFQTNNRYPYCASHQPQVNPYLKVQNPFPTEASPQSHPNKQSDTDNEKANEPGGPLDRVSSAYTAAKQLKRWGWNIPQYNTIPKELSSDLEANASTEAVGKSAELPAQELLVQDLRAQELPAQEKESEKHEQAEVVQSPIKRLLSVWDKLYS